MITVTWNGNTYNIPEDGESGWGVTLTNYLVALSNAAVAGVLVPPLKIPNNATNPSFVEAGITGSSVYPTVLNLQACSAQFANTFSYLFQMNLGTGQSLLCSASYKETSISAINDASIIFLNADSGTGIFISKLANSSTINFKNRMGVSVAIEIKTLSSNLSAVTAWS